VVIDFIEAFNKEVIAKNKDFLGFGNIRNILKLNLNNRSYIIICGEIVDNVQVKACYNIYGSFINKVKDSYSFINSNDNEQSKFVYKRESKNKITYFNEKNEVIQLEKKIEFKSIKNDLNIDFKKGKTLNN